MNQRLIILHLLFLMVFDFVSAQDTIRFRDGSIVGARILEVTNNTVKYKKSDNPDGPLFTAGSSDVLMINYRNGSRDIFTRIAGQPEIVRPISSEPVTLPTVKFNGPRVGCTYIGAGNAAKWITDQGKQPFVSQFGWQLESRIFSANDITGLVELVGLIAGLEQGLFLPSASLLFGLRGKDGYELGAGPNVSPTGLGMVFAVGRSFHINEIYFPVNLSFVPSVNTSKTIVNYNRTKTTVTERTGFRVSLLIGFSSRKR